MSDWYYAVGRQQLGPVRKETLIELIADGNLGPKTLVWSYGMTQWKPIQSIVELAILPPPLPILPELPELPVEPVPMIRSPVSPQIRPVSARNPPDNSSREEIERYKILAIMAYLPPLFLIPLLFYRRTSFVRFHSAQGFTLMMCWGAGLIAGKYIDVGIRHLPLFYHGLGGLVSMVEMIPVAFMIIGIFNSAQGLSRPLPIVGRWRFF